MWLGLAEKLIPSRALQREADSDRTLVDSVLQRLKESTLSLGEVQEGNFQVVEPATTAVSLANRRNYIILGALLGGALLAAGAVAGLHKLDSSIRTVDSAERLLGRHVLTAIPIVANAGGTGGMLALVQQPNSVAAESFRTLRSSLTATGSREAPQTVLFTSAVPGEGKSFVAVNAAIAFAQQGYNTLLVEADLRRPSLAGGLLGIEGKLAGIGDYVTGSPVPITSTPIPHLSLLASGSRIERPAELLSSSAFEELVTWMKTSFDRIVIDSAPVNVVSDTLNIVQWATIVCLVVRCSATPRKVVRRAIELLQRTGVKPYGLVLNRTPKWNGIGYHYDYAGRSNYGAPENYGASKNGALHLPPRPASSAKTHVVVERR